MASLRIHLCKSQQFSSNLAPTPGSSPAIRTHRSPKPCDFGPDTGLKGTQPLERQLLKKQKPADFCQCPINFGDLDPELPSLLKDVSIREKVVGYITPLSSYPGLGSLRPLGHSQASSDCDDLSRACIFPEEEYAHSLFVLPPRDPFYRSLPGINPLHCKDL